MFYGFSAIVELITKESADAVPCGGDEDVEVPVLF